MGLSKILERVEHSLVRLLARRFSTGESQEAITCGVAELNRRWVWAPTFGIFDNMGVYLGVGQWLVQYKGQPETPPRWVRGWYIQLRPFEWGLGQEHIYYDGPHCIFSFGPIKFVREWSWCKKCSVG